MALLVILVMVTFTQALKTNGEMALANITRFASGDLFSLVGKDKILYSYSLLINHIFTHILLT